MARSDEIASKDHIRRRRLAYRCWHRGMREMDLLLGRFGDARIAGMTPNELAELEVLLDIPDADLLTWITSARDPGAGEAHAGVSTAMIEEIRAFHAGNPTVRDVETQ